MAKKRSLRRRMIRSGMTTCFYCGLSFTTGILSAGTPGAARARRFARLTLEHLQAVACKGATTAENCVLAHAWCNTTAADKLVAEKLQLKALLSVNSGIPPWWPVMEKIIQKQKG
ncbi:hypothetical protein HRH25_11895 [Flavisolibacter sp. BT320]|nr:hypothetical protein [Flavisolibacter longurius]